MILALKVSRPGQLSSLYQSLVLFGSLIMFSKMVASVQSSLSTHHYKVQVHCLVYSQVHCRMVADLRLNSPHQLPYTLQRHHQRHHRLYCHQHQHHQHHQHCLHCNHSLLKRLIAETVISIIVPTLFFLMPLMVPPPPSLPSTPMTSATLFASSTMHKPRPLTD